MASLPYINPRRIRAGLLLRNEMWIEGYTSNTIPGYDSPPENGPSGAPIGWSMRTFRELAAEAICQETKSGLRKS